MYNSILVPIDLAETELAKPAISAAVIMAQESGGTLRLINVLPLTPVMLAEYVPPDFETQQRKSAEDALADRLQGDRARRRRRSPRRSARAASIRRFWKRRRRSRPTSSS